MVIKLIHSLQKGIPYHQYTLSWFCRSRVCEEQHLHCSCYHSVYGILAHQAWHQFKSACLVPCRPLPWLNNLSLVCHLGCFLSVFQQPILQSLILPESLKCLYVSVWYMCVCVLYVYIQVRAGLCVPWMQVELSRQAGVSDLAFYISWDRFSLPLHMCELLRTLWLSHQKSMVLQIYTTASSFMQSLETWTVFALTGWVLYPLSHRPNQKILISTFSC